VPELLLEQLDPEPDSRDVDREGGKLCVGGADASPLPPPFLDQLGVPRGTNAAHLRAMIAWVC
jgi:hypothetical protein